MYADHFGAPEFKPLTLQHDLFVDPGFDSLALIVCSRPIVSLVYVITTPILTLGLSAHHSSFFLLNFELCDVSDQAEVVCWLSHCEFINSWSLFVLGTHCIL